MTQGEGAPALLIAGARKEFRMPAGGCRVAVSDVSLSVSGGAVHGLLGPNGAGKTTTLKMLLGLVRPSAGRFEILGTNAHEAGARASLGFLPEQPYFPIQLTALEALTLYGRLARRSRADVVGLAPSLLERVGLGGQERTQLSKFSRGMLQRLGLAQAMLGGPKVIVLDEPASGLDPVGQRDVRNLMLELRDAGSTVLLSSHQLSEVEAVCDEVTILNRGKVAARGRIDDLLNTTGQSAVRARGMGPLPEQVAALVADVAYSGDSSAFSIASADIRRVIDALDEAGWKIESIAPKRDSLEDYFARMLDASPSSPNEEEGIAS